MRIVTGDEMRKLDERAIRELELPSLVLMENAGTASVRRILEQFGSLAQAKVHVLVGAGNNGGDGLVVARHLLNRGVRVRAVMLAAESKLSPDCRHNLEIFRKLDGDVEWLTEQSLPKLRFALGMSQLIIDAMLGTGAEGGLRGLYAKVRDVVNEVHTPVVALDVPTGVQASTGAVEGSAVRAQCTVTFGFVKQGLLLYPGAEYVGELFVEDIGIPHALARHIERYVMDRETMEKLLPKRPGWGHKGTFGHGLVVAGSREMAGSAYLTARAMLRSGAGLVTLAVPESIAGWYPPGELLVVPIPETEQGTFGEVSLQKLRGLLERKQVLVLGPGMSRGEDVTVVVKTLLERWQGPVVLDADAINCLQRQESWLETIPLEQRSQWVLTPHPGEMARLTGTDIPTINHQRPQVVRESQRKLGSVILLKGAPTVTAGAGRVVFNSSGNPGMGSAGMGDVLTGVIGSLLAQGMTPMDAAVVGAYAHGLAADQAAGVLGERGLVANDVLERLPYVLA